jgi:hypothetical protein
MYRWVMVVWALHCWMGHTAMAEAPWPLKTPAELKALHGPNFSGARILTYRHTVDPIRSETAPETVIGIGKDFLFRQEGKTRFVVDLRLGRIYAGTDKRYVSYPMAANIVFWDSELANRAVLNKAAAAARLPAGISFDPFWNAVELRLTLPGDPPPTMETREEDGETVFSYKSEEALRWRPMSEPLPDAAAAHLRHVLLWLWPVHPTLAASISAQGKAPQHLMVRVYVAGQSQRHDYQLIKSDWCETCDALPADAEPIPSEGSSGDAFETDLVPIMVAASAGKFMPVSSDEYLRRTDAALDRGATLEAFLWFIERSLQDGIQPCQLGNASEQCRVQNRFVEHVKTSADVQGLQRYMTLRTQEAVGAIMALRDKVRANAYYIDLIAMNALPPAALRFKSADQEPLKSAQRQMRAALAAMPMVPAVYRDIGNIYFAAVNPWHAWFAWEMGKANAGRSAEPNLWQFVNNLEQQVRQRRGRRAETAGIHIGSEAELPRVFDGGCAVITVRYDLSSKEARSWCNGVT